MLLLTNIQCLSFLTREKRFFGAGVCTWRPEEFQEEASRSFHDLLSVEEIDNSRA
jgi:hypothetical protein